MALLGLVQGLTEFLPVSSSGHLVLAAAIFGAPSLGVREVVVLHLGTLVGMVHFFRRDLLLLVGLRPAGLAPLSAAARRRRLGLLAVGTVVTVGIALGVEPWLGLAFESLEVVGVGLLVTAAALLATVRRARRNEGGVLDGLGIRGAVLVGLAQAAALCPGISRSGITISAGLALGLRQSEAARFSFLLAFPVIAGAVVRELAPVLAGSGSPESAGSVVGAPASAPAGALVVGGAVAALSGWLALRFLFGLFRRTTLGGFAYYCVAASALAFGLAIAGR